jgi:hypothetical protein
MELGVYVDRRGRERRRRKRRKKKKRDGAGVVCM